MDDGYAYDWFDRTDTERGQAERFTEQEFDDFVRETDEQRRDRIRRDIGENYPKTCRACGRKYWSIGEHWESCNGVKAA